MSDRPDTAPTAPEVTNLLQQMAGGDTAAAEQLLPLVYRELRDLAHARMARERPGQTLTPTGLVHEAYLRLVQSRSDWDGRSHFFGAAAEAMRRILIDIARRKSAMRHGGDLQRKTLTDALDHGQYGPDELLALDQSLDRLEQQDPRLAQVVKLHYFAGLTVQETAEAMAISGRTASRLWTRARAWLYCDMG
ncbi:MAG: ECF-type sigma factor [Xanthomonadales bacterium]|nr:ECF-type sigma factor [Xanthomonadales bacterium]